MSAADDTLARARACHERGDLALAEAGYREVLALRPEDTDALHLLGVVRHRRGDPHEAARLIARASALAPGSAELARNLGLALGACGDAAGAVAAFERALALEPDDPRARLQLASTLHRAGDARAALEHYRRALEQLPDLPELHNQIGICLLQLDDPAAAEAAFARCLRHDPEHADGRENLARAQLRTRRFESAERALAALVAQDPGREEAWRLLGFARLYRGEIEGACDAFLTPVRRRFAPGGAGGDPPADPATVTRTKLLHDLEQIEFLAARGTLDAARAAALAGPYRLALEALPPDTDSRFFHDAPSTPGFAAVFNRLHVDHQAARVSPSALDPRLDLEALDRAFHRDGFAVADGFLTAQALAGLQRFCTEPTLWFEKKFRHEVGASLRNGFCCPLLLQIAEELRRAFPDTFGRHLFSGCFSYKYFPSDAGGNVHADRGAVSMNMWITPDSANLAPSGGGLVIWNKRVPAEYFKEQPEEIDDINAALVNAPDAEPRIVDYRCNRAILFPSDVLHRTDVNRFAPGYENRRISVTLLFGRPGE